MPYVTQEDFEEAFGRRELEELLHEGTDFKRVEADACGVVDGYLAARYSLPLASVPALVKGWALDVTRFRLWDEHAPEEVRRRYDDVMTQLRDLARGLISLPPGADGQTAGVSGFASDGFSADRVFTMDGLKGF